MENNKLPTAEEFLDLQHQTVPSAEFDIRQVMIEFARLHTKAALEEADGEVPLYCSEGVLNCYPPERIK